MRNYLPFKKQQSKLSRSVKRGLRAVASYPVIGMIAAVIVAVVIFRFAFAANTITNCTWHADEQLTNEWTGNGVTTGLGGNSTSGTQFWNQKGYMYRAFNLVIGATDSFGNPENNNTINNRGQLSYNGVAQPSCWNAGGSNVPNTGILDSSTGPMDWGAVTGTFGQRPDDMRLGMPNLSSANPQPGANGQVGPAGNVVFCQLYGDLLGKPIATAANKFMSGPVGTNHGSTFDCNGSDSSSSNPVRAAMHIDDAAEMTILDQAGKSNIVYCEGMGGNVPTGQADTHCDSTMRSPGESGKGYTFVSDNCNNPTTDFKNNATGTALVLDNTDWTTANSGGNCGSAGNTDPQAWYSSYENGGEFNPTSFTHYRLSPIIGSQPDASKSGNVLKDINITQTAMSTVGGGIGNSTVVSFRYPIATGIQVQQSPNSFLMSEGVNNPAGQFSVTLTPASMAQVPANGPGTATYGTPASLVVTDVFDNNRLGNVTCGAPVTGIACVVNAAAGTITWTFSGTALTNLDGNISTSPTQLFYNAKTNYLKSGDPGIISFSNKVYLNGTSSTGYGIWMFPEDSGTSWCIGQNPSAGACHDDVSNNIYSAENPFLTTTGGDIHAGGGIGYQISCAPAAGTQNVQGQNSASNINPNGATYGSRGDYVVSSGGPVVSNFGSNFPAIGSNNDNNPSLQAANYPNVCRPDLVAAAQSYVASNAISSFGSVGFPDPTKPVLQLSADQWNGGGENTILNSAGPGTGGWLVDITPNVNPPIIANTHTTINGRITVFADPGCSGCTQNLFVGQGVNLSYGVATNPLLVPSLGLISSGDIDFLSGPPVDNTIVGYWWAGKNINTCTYGFGQNGPPGAVVLGSDVDSQCNSHLTLSGLMAADNFTFERTGPVTGVKGLQLSETLNFDARVIASPPPVFSGSISVKTGSINSVDMAPRF